MRHGYNNRIAIVVVVIAVVAILATSVFALVSALMPRLLAPASGKPPAASQREQIVMKPSWPETSPDEKALAYLSEKSRSEISKSPVPVLIPNEQALPRFSHSVLMSTDEGYFYSAQDDGTGVTVSASNITFKYDLPPYVPPSVDIRGGRGYIATGDGSGEASWEENGIIYSLGIRCYSPVDVRCSNDNLLKEILGELTYVGGRESVRVEINPSANTSNQPEATEPRDFQDPLNEPTHLVASHDGKWKAYSIFTDISSPPTMYLEGKGVKRSFVGAVPYAFAPDDTLLLLTQKPSWEEVGGLTVISIPPTSEPRLLINKGMKEIGGPTPPGYITDPLDAASIQWNGHTITYSNEVDGQITIDLDSGKVTKSGHAN